jgi:membrane associated rhomboid family serine protease
MLMAFGAAAERMMGPKKTAIFFFLSGFAGAAFQFALNPTTPIPMVGCSGALSGLFAVIIMRLQESGQMPAGRFGIWGVGALWIGLSLVAAFIGGDIGIGNVAWGAHAGGFIAGVFLARVNYFRT